MTPSNEYELRLKQLEREIELVALEKRALQEKLDYLNLQREVENKNFSLAASVSLKYDWLQIAKELDSLKEESDAELREGLCIDFANKFRVRALADLEQDADGILVVKATAYEILYRSSVRILENRNLRVKISRRDGFEQAKVAEKETRVRRETVKIEKERAATPEGRMIAAMMALGVTREEAERSVQMARDAAREMK